MRGQARQNRETDRQEARGPEGFSSVEVGRESIGDRLFKQTFAVYRALTNGTRTELSEPLPFATYNEKRIGELKSSVESLLGDLAELYGRPELDDLDWNGAGIGDRGYVDSYAAQLDRYENPDIDELLKALASSLFYFSDRWCVERYFAVKGHWEALSAELGRASGTNHLPTSPS